MEMVETYEAKCNPPLSRLLFNLLRPGITAFGGPAMIPYVRKMAVEQNQRIDGEPFQDRVALRRTNPEATVMQMAAYNGLKTWGVPGIFSRGTEPCG